MYAVYAGRTNFFSLFMNQRFQTPSHLTITFIQWQPLVAREHPCLWFARICHLYLIKEPPLLAFSPIMLQRTKNLDLRHCNVHASHRTVSKLNTCTWLCTANVGSHNFKCTQPSSPHVVLVLQTLLNLKLPLISVAIASHNSLLWATNSSPVTYIHVITWIMSWISSPTSGPLIVKCSVLPEWNWKGGSVAIKADGTAGSIWCVSCLVNLPVVPQNSAKT